MNKQVMYKNGDLIEYEILKLVEPNDPILRTPTKDIDFTTAKTDFINHIMYSLTKTLDQLGGLGLSANQVGLEHRACAVNMGEELWVLFNPYVIESSTTTSKFREGCLTFPGLYLTLNRPEHIRVRFQAAGGQEVIKEFDGLTAVVLQHEIDHLDGVVFTDKISPIKLDIAKRKVKTNLKKLKRAGRL